MRRGMSSHWSGQEYSFPLCFLSLSDRRRNQRLQWNLLVFISQVLIGCVHSRVFKYRHSLLLLMSSSFNVKPEFPLGQTCGPTSDCLATPSVAMGTKEPT